jgi:hypothetical protein
MISEFVYNLSRLPLSNYTLDVQIKMRVLLILTLDELRLENE